MELDYQLVLQLSAALAIGLLIGSERGWSDRECREGTRVAGVRTFGIIGLLGGVSVVLAQQFDELLLAVVFLAVSALVIVAHVLDFRSDQDRGTTTAFVMLLTFLLSAWAAGGQPLPALGVASVVVALLGYKRTLHRWLEKITAEEFTSSVILLLISVVMLPLLPDQGYGPWDALNPYWIWWMVVLISSLSFAGYIAIKFTGRRLGTLLTAIAGGLASSTAITVTLANFCRHQPHKQLFVAGILVAASIMFVRVIIEVSIVNAGLLPLLWLPLTLMFAGVLVVAGFFWRNHTQGPAELSQQIELPNPLQLATAIKFGLLLALILLLSRPLTDWFGDSGVYVLAVVSGLMDVDAITLSLAKMSQGEIAPQVAASGILIASVSNTLVKGAIFAFIVGPKKNLWFLGVLLLALLPGIAAGVLLA